MIKKANKSITQKLILSIICVMLIINFTMPTYSQADGILNNLFNPIKGLVCAIADSCMSLIQACFIGDMDMITPETVDHNDSSRWGGFLWFENGINWPTIKITPEEIFQGKIPALNVNFITEPSADLNTEYEKRKKEIEAQMAELDPSSEAYQLLQKRLQDTQNEKQDLALTTDKTQTALVGLRNTISRWYMTLRNIAIVGLLCILVYVGIRMMLCSIASEKAKYKQMFMDWVIALCLIFFLHYIMALTMTVTEQITKIFSSSSVVGIKIMAEDQGLTKDGVPKNTVNNLMEYVRLYVNLADVGQSLSYIIIYVCLVAYTVKFIITYVKRFIHMAFLTMIAPLVALTYPLDKISDGKAQAFDMWLKDYIFNALIQPFHLIIYTVFVTSAIDFATNNLIYTCVAIGFISHAEKFMRKMFGFDKAPNAADTNGSFAGGALAASLLNKATSAAGKGGNGGGSGGSGGSDAPKPPKTQPDASGYMGDGSNQPSAPAGGADENGDDPANNFDSGAGQDSEGDPGALPDGQPQNGDENVLNEEEVNQLEAGDDNQLELDDDGNIRLPDENGDPDTQNPLDSGDDGQGAGNNPQQPNNSQSDNSGKKKISGWDKARRYGSVLTKHGGKLLKPALKVGGGVLGAAAGGLGALATGGDITKGMMTGAGVGAGLGTAAGKLPSAVGNAARNVKSGVQEFGADWKGINDKKEADKDRYRNQFMNSKAKQDYVKKYFESADGGTLSGNELKQKMNQLYEYERAGITDIDTQKELMEMEDKKMQEGYSQENARQQVLYANHLASKYSKKDLIEKSEKYKEDQVATMMENGLSEADARNATDKIFNDMYKIHGISVEGQRQKEQARAQQKLAEAQAAQVKAQKDEADRKRNEDFQNAIIDLAKNAKK